MQKYAKRIAQNMLSTRQAVSARNCNICLYAESVPRIRPNFFNENLRGLSLIRP